MSHASKLAEWRENLRVQKEQRELQVSIDCLQIADAVLEKLINLNFAAFRFVYVSSTYNQHLYINTVHINTGKCDLRSFQTIMQARCKATFGEKCVVKGDSNYWSIGFYKERTE